MAGKVLMRIFSIDFETFLSRRSEHAPRIVCGAWSSDGITAEIGLRAAALSALIEAAREPGTMLLNMFLAYDLACALEEFERHPELYARQLGRFGSVAEVTRLIWNALRDGRCIGIDICQQLLDVARGEGLIEHRETQGYNLPNICRWNGIEAEDKDDHAWRLFYAQLEGIDPELWPRDAVQYVLDDATKPHRVLAAQMIENQKWIDSYGHPVLHQAPENTWSQLCLHLVAAHGVRVNPGRVERLASIVKKEIDGYARILRHDPKCDLEDAGPAKEPGKCQGCLRPLVGDLPEPLLKWKKDKGAWRLSRDTKLAAKRMREAMARLGLAVTMTEPSKKFPEGQVQLDEDACILSDDKVLQAYADFTGANVLQSRVEDLRTGVTGWPLHTSFTTVRATGRTSSRKPREPHFGTQMQNWPRVEGARESLEPRDIWVPA